VNPRLRQFLCGLLRGHDLVEANSRCALVQRCVTCGYVTPGVTWMEAPPAPTSLTVLRFVDRLEA
jgi:hypothetical protein